MWHLWMENWCTWVLYDGSIEATGVSFIPSEKQRLSEGCQCAVIRYQRAVGTPWHPRPIHLFPTNPPAAAADLRRSIIKSLHLVEEMVTRNVAINEDKVTLYYLTNSQASGKHCIVHPLVRVKQERKFENEVLVWSGLVWSGWPTKRWPVGPPTRCQGPKLLLWY